VGEVHGKRLVSHDAKLENVLLDKRYHAGLGSIGFTFCDATGYAAPETKYLKLAPPCP
jgi:hypothetical protein